MKTPRRRSRFVSLLVLSAALPLPAVSQTPPAFTPLRRDVGIGVPSSLFDTIMPYRHTFGESGFGRFIFNKTYAPVPPSASGVQAPYGTIAMNVHSETADGEYLYVNFRGRAQWTGLSSGNPGDVMPALDDIPFNMVFFSTAEPLPYGIEMDSLHAEVTAGDHSGVGHMTGLVKDPGRAYFLDRNSRFGYVHSSVITTPLGAGDPANIIYRYRKGVAEGAPNGILPAGDYGLSTLMAYVVSDGGNQAGEHGILSEMESWIVIGRVAAWKESLSGSYTDPARWIARQTPAANFRVLFKRPDATYTVTGLTGTVRQFGFGGGHQTLTLQGGTGHATEKILATASDRLRLAGATLSSPLFTVEGGAQFEVLEGGALHADATASGRIDVAVENGTASLVVQPGGHVRAGTITLGQFSSGGGDEAAAAPRPPGVAATAEAVPGLQLIEGRLQVGANALSGAPACAVTQALSVLGGAMHLTSGSAEIDRTAGPESFVIHGGHWTNDQTLTLARTGTAHLLVADGGTLETGRLDVADQSGTTGTLTVTREAQLTAGPVTLAERGTAAFALSAASQAQLQNLTLAAQSGSSARLDVTDGSRLTAQGLSVGARGRATVELSGASSLTTQALNIAPEPGSQGTVTVRGTGTILQPVLVDIGEGGSGLLDLRDGAVLQGDGARIDVHAQGVLQLQGSGTLLTEGGLNLDAGSRLTVTEGARIAGHSTGLFADAGSHVLFAASPDNQFTQIITIATRDFAVTNGSTLTWLNGVVKPTAVLRLDGAGTTVTVGNSLLLQGTLVIGAGALVRGGPDGTLALDATTRISGHGGSLQFELPIDNQFGILLPGESPGQLTIDGDYVQGPGGALELEIAGPTPGTQHDQLIVTGNLTLQGTVVLKFRDGFAPAAGQHFDLLVVGGDFASTPRVVVQGLQAGWQFSTAFDAATGGFTLTSLTAGVPATPLAGGPAGDADADGLANLLETSLGTDPLLAGDARLPASVVVNDPADGKAYLHFTYERALAATASIFTVEVSDDLVNWTSGPEVTVPVGDPVLSADGERLAITMRVLPALDDPAARRRFVRLRVTE